jgi:osmoprotectant transport system permease protein
MPSLGLILPIAQGGQVGKGFFQQHSTTSCPGNNGVCPGWMLDHLDRYTHPALQHLVLVLVSVGLGFAIAFGLAILSHRRRALVPTFMGTTGVLYTVPSLAFFSLLLPFTGRGTDTAIIALTAYTLQIIYRNVVAGLDNVPAEARDVGRGMGMTERQLFWRVEVPLAMPEIVAGLRVATVSTVALATLAVFAGAGGLGDPIYSQLNFKGNVIVAGGLAILIALLFDQLLVGALRLLSPWRRARPG